MTSQSWKRIIPSFILSIMCAAARRKETIFIFSREIAPFFQFSHRHAIEFEM